MENPEFKMQEHGSFDANIRKQHEEFESSVRELGTAPMQNAEQSPLSADAEQRLAAARAKLQQNEAAPDNVVQLPPRPEEEQEGAA